MREEKTKQIDDLRLLTFSNNQLSELIEILKDSITSVIISEFDGNIVYVNKVFENRTGYSYSEVIGKNPRFLKSDETNPEKHKKLWETITSGEEWRGEFKNKRKSGELFWEYSTIYPIKDHANRIEYFLAIKEDISQIKLLEESLKEATNKKKSKGLKFDFLKQISYEILSPLNTSLELVPLIRKKCESDVCAKCINSNNYLDIINQQGKKIIKATELLINISEMKTEAVEVKLNLLGRIFINNFLVEIKDPIFVILGILSLLKEGCVKKEDVELRTGFNVIYNSCNRIISTIDIIFEYSQDENDEIRFYNNVLSRIFDEKEKLEKPSMELTSTTPAIKKIVRNHLNVGQATEQGWLNEIKTEENKAQNKTLMPLSEIKLSVEPPQFLFKRNKDLIVETKNVDDSTIVLINSYRATLTEAKEIKEFICNIIEAGARKIIVDLSLCNNLDSTFAGVLVIIKRKVKEVAGKIVLVFNNRHVYSESFALLNIELQFEIYSTLENAIIDFK